MKLLVRILGFIIGAYMLADGIYVMVNGKYIGPEKPGPWAALFYKLGVAVFSLGPLFILFGLLWLAFVAAFRANSNRMRTAGLILSVATLWYLPVGTLLSLVIIGILLFRTRRAGR